MNSFFEHHKDSIRWHYRCFDRIPDAVDRALANLWRPGCRYLHRKRSPATRNMLTSARNALPSGSILEGIDEILTVTRLGLPTLAHLHQHD
jgi:hypothetical protein